MDVSYDEYLEEVKLYQGSKIANKIKGEETSTDEASNQRIQRTNWTNSALNEIRKLPKVRA